MRTKLIALLALICLFGLSGCTSRISWDEDVLLMDGRVITVKRDARILRVLLADGMGSVQEQKFSYPPLNVSWHTNSLRELAIAFDVIDGTAYLVTDSGDMCRKGDGSIDGVNVTAWKNGHSSRVSVDEAPLSMMTVNLHTEFQGRSADDDTHTHQTLQLKRDGWRTGINRFGGEPHQGMALLKWMETMGLRGCIDKIASPQELTKTSSFTVELERLAEKTYTPPMNIQRDAEPLASDRSERCKSQLTSERPRKEPHVGWVFFVADPTGQKQAPIGHLLCNADAVWSVEYANPEGSTSLAKFDANGNLLYRVRFSNPIDPQIPVGAIMPPTLKSEGGFVSFAWWNLETVGPRSDIRVSRMANVRFREPEPGTMQRDTAGH